MEKIAVDGPKTPIGFLSSLWKGVELVNAHPGVVIFPVILDSFLWFGPRLSMYALIKPIIDSMAYASTASAMNAAMFDTMRLSAEKFNLFSLLAFLPLFPPSLMAGNSPDQTPLGNPIILPVTNWMGAIGLGAGLLLLSIMIGSAYWVFAGGTTQPTPWRIRDSFARWARTVLVVALLFGVFVILILAFSIPMIFIISLIAVASPDSGTFLSQLFFFLGGGFLFWVTLFFMFSMHGTVLFRDGILPAIWNSINTSRWMYPLSIWIPILLIMVNFLSSAVWSLAPDSSWAGAVGVLGNAYTSSVVVIASMAYYIDKRRWISEVRTYLQSRMAGKNPPGVI